MRYLLGGNPRQHREEMRMLYKTREIRGGTCTIVTKTILGIVFVVDHFGDPQIHDQNCSYNLVRGKQSVTI